VGVIRGTLAYGETHELTDDARAVVVLVQGSGDPRAGTVIASTYLQDPGPEPVPFELLYALDDTTAGEPYELWAGIVDGDLAWATPSGTAVKAPWPLTEDVELALEFRPDLLKGAVSGTIAGVGLDPARDPEAYATALVVRVDTGETIGFQLIAPTGAAPVPFSVPYDPAAIDDNADYVARGSVWDGTSLWAVNDGIPVITRGNATANIVMPVTVVERATPEPAPTPAATAPPEPGTSGDSGPGLVWILVVVGLAILGIGALAAYLRSRRGPAEPPATGS
jgi:uncharacterized lipoprotein YbaY